MAAEVVSGLSEAAALVAAGSAGLGAIGPGAAHPAAGGWDEATPGGHLHPLRALEALDGAAARLESLDASLRGVPGLTCLLRPAAPASSERPAVADRDAPPGDAVAAVSAAAGELGGVLDALEADLDAGLPHLDPADLETLNAIIVRLRDSWWAIARDRVGSARSVAALARPGLDSTPQAIGALWAIDVACSSIDRLEVRGRDSAGVHVLVTGPGLERVAADADTAGRADPLFRSRAVRALPGSDQVAFVYKAAAEIGELGDNVAALRHAISTDALLAAALSSPDPRVTVLGHTRWASVGVISEPNAHPLNSDETAGAASAPYVAAALNGDVDNHHDLRATHALAVPGEISTDAKVIPALVSRRLAAGESSTDAWLATVRTLDGSVAVVASLAGEPDRLHLALRGSGQALYVGLAEDAYVVASEPYGLVQETSRYLRMDGEATQGQVVVLDRSAAGSTEGVQRRRYNGAALPVGAEEVRSAGITTRDIDRGGFPHFLLKEIFQAPGSLRKTLRGKVLASPDGRLGVGLGPDALPAEVVAALAERRVRKAVVIGQGTAAVAGRAVAAAIAACNPQLQVSASLASELSGFGLADDMADTLVVAVSQSGTTTDTNRAVDLVRARGAQVLAVVNRRGSDLVSKAHGTLYTSDGRDVEMSVASTKAFYAQVAAGWLLALALARAGGVADPDDTDRRLRALRDLPAAMEAVIARREDIGRVAAAVAPPRRYWTVVGSGPDAVAAAEVRIKLSELCYRSIAFDSIEDKKHIDLSCEPLILVCAAGVSGPNVDDVAKEVAIYRAHKACPVVVVSEADAARFSDDAEVVAVPAVDPELAFVLSAMVGHLFGYEAALAIDAQARPLRAARGVLDDAAAGGVGPDDLLRSVGAGVGEAAAPFLAGLAAGTYDGNLTSSTATSLVSLLRYVTGALPVEGYEVETGKVGAPEVLVADLYRVLSDAIDQLTRPVDAIKHQAKTVTVGTSRSEDSLLARPLVAETLAVGASADTLGYRALRTLAALDPAVVAVTGHTRYRIDWSAAPWPTATVVDQGGDLLGVESRTASDPRLQGTKHRAAEEREVTVVRGARDGRTVVLVPEVKASSVIGMTLLHVNLADTVPAPTARAVLTGYRGRYAALRDAVTESEPNFDDARLAEVPIADLLTEPVWVLAARWRDAGAAGRR